jgi:hypothetical protein
LRVGRRRRRIRIDDQRNLAPQVVDDRQLFGQQQQQVGNVRESRCRRLGGIRKPGFDVPDDVVAENAGQATAKARQPGQRRRVEARAVRLDEGERIAVVRLAHAAVALDIDVAPACAQPHLRGKPDERIAAEPFAADDRFEQERIARVGELEVQRQRRVEIRERFEDERNTVVALRGERAELAFGDHASTFCCRTSSIGASLWLGRATRTRRLKRGAASATRPRGANPQQRAACRSPKRRSSSLLSQGHARRPMWP